MVRRSVLFSPGDRPSLMEKAPGVGADAVVFDLEDAVVPARKAEAREAVRDVLAADRFDPACEVCVRLTLEEPERDLEVLVGAETLRLDALVLPKVESADTVRRRAKMARSRGLDVPILSLVETAAGVLAAEEIAAAEPTAALVFGAEDLSADVGATRTAAGTEVLYAREHVVLAASAAGVDAIDTVYTDFEDDDGLREETSFARQLGFDGKLAIHPAQVPVINDAFTPGESEREWARRVLAARAEADRDERGVFEVDGEMIDRPLIARAERIRELSAAAGIDPDPEPGPSS
ncbi:MAG: CoA ester lyase [Haloferacaceae archaeon]